MENINKNGYNPPWNKKHPDPAPPPPPKPSTILNSPNICLTDEVSDIHKLETKQLLNEILMRQEYMIDLIKGLVR